MILTRELHAIAFRFIQRILVYSFVRLITDPELKTQRQLSQMTRPMLQSHLPHQWQQNDFFLISF
jgi:hypothetical protein